MELKANMKIEKEREKKNLHNKLKNYFKLDGRKLFSVIMVFAVILFF